MKNSDNIKEIVYKSLEDLDEACDATVKVCTKCKKIHLRINNNPVLKIGYIFFTNDDDIKPFIKKQIEKRIKRNTFKRLYVAYLKDGFRIKDVTFTTNIFIKEKINSYCFSYYASISDHLFFLKKNKRILTSEKSEIIRIPKGEDGFDFSQFAEAGNAAEPAANTRNTQPIVPIINNNDFITRIGGNTSLSRTDPTFSYPQDLYVFVFDTGIEEHPLLNINKKESRDFTVPEFVDGRPNPVFREGWRIDSDDRNRTTLSGHGTHVAGTIGADDTDDTRFPVKFAVAPKVQVIAYKVIPGNTVNMERALTSLARFRDNNKSAKIIVNMSLGFPVGQRLPTNLFGFERTMNILASEKNITFIAAAGNSTQNSSSSSPARIESVITVASYNNVNQFSQFSNFGPIVDIMAPGERIFSTWLNNGFNYNQGTSMAAPVVAGACVNMLAVEARRNPTNVLTSQQIKTRLSEDAINSSNDNGGPNNASRNPRIQMPIRICPEPPAICITSGTNANTVPFPVTFPHSVFIGRYINNSTAVQNY